METIVTIKPFNKRGELSNVIYSKIYKIATKVNEGVKLTRDEKNSLTSKINDNCFFRGGGVPLMGMIFDFSKIVNLYVVKQYGSVHEYYGIDKTSLRNHIYGKIDYIKQI